MYLKLNLSFVRSFFLPFFHFYCVSIYLSLLLVNNDDMYQVHVLLSRAVLSYWLNTNITLSRSFEMCRRSRSCQSILSLPSIRNNLDYSLTRNRRSLSLSLWISQGKPRNHVTNADEFAGESETEREREGNILTSRPKFRIHCLF